MEWVKLLMQKAKMHFYEDLDSDSSFTPSTKTSVPPPMVVTSPRKCNLANSYNALLPSFPIRREEPRELHQNIWKDQSFKCMCGVFCFVQAEEKGW
eukprot:5072767-Ditylum_brightwellii.AAC.1